MKAKNVVSGVLAAAAVGVLVTGRTATSMSQEEARSYNGAIQGLLTVSIASQLTEEKPKEEKEEK